MCSAMLGYFPKKADNVGLNSFNSSNSLDFCLVGNFSLFSSRWRMENIAKCTQKLYHLACNCEVRVGMCSRAHEGAGKPV